MSTPNQIRRNVMHHAWLRMRGRRALGESHTRADFAELLRAAWVAIKADMIELARLAASPKRKVKAFRRVTSSALIVSPMTNALRRRGETNVWAKARSESYLVSMVGA